MELGEKLTTGFSGGSKLTENKKRRVEKALLSLLLEWKNLEEHVDLSTQQSLEACLTDIQSRHERLNSVQESVTESNGVLDELRKNLEERCEEIDRKDNDVREYYEEKRKELAARANKLNFCRRFVEKSVKDSDLREKEIEEKRKVIEELFEKFNLERSEFEKIKAVVDGRFEEMKSKERGIEELHEKLNSERSELGRIEGFVVKSFKEMQLREKSLKNREIEVSEKMKNVLEKEKEVELKEMELVSMRNLNEQKRKEVESMEESIILKERQLDMRKGTQTSSREFNSQKEKLDLEKKLVNERTKELELKEKYFKEWVETIDLKEKEIDWRNVSTEERCKELEVKERNFDDRLKEFELKEKHFKQWVKTIDLKEKDIDLMRITNEKCVNAITLKENEIESKRILNEDRSKILDSKEKCLHDMLTDFKLKEQQLEQRVESLEVTVKEVNSIRISCEERCRKLELEKKSLEDKLKVFELKKNELRNVDYSIVKTEPRSDDSSYANIRFSVTMDGKNLLLYLIDHKRDLDSMNDEVFKALRLSKDPANLVLDAIQDFYLKKEDKDFEVDVVCRSTILLLEQLRRISPPIQSRMQEAALELAREWKVKMKNLQEVIVFLQLLASYKLGSAFEPREFLSVFEVIGQQKQVLELCQLLGYTDKISDLVQDLLNKQHHILAVRYVCAFGLHDKYKPASLLKEFWKNAEEASETLHNNGNMSVNAKDEVIDNIVASLREAVVCISNHKIETEFSPQSFEIFMSLLARQKEAHKVVLSTSDNDARKKQRAEKNCKSATNGLNPTRLDQGTNGNQEPHGPALDTESAMAVILSHMSGNSLQFFLNENAEDHEVIINHVASALRLAKEPAKFVLKSIQGFYPPHLEIGDKQYTSPIVMRSCTLLLEQLMKLSPKIKIRVKEDALKLAFDWKAKMGNHLQVLGFLHLITAYGLNSSFDLGELASLFISVSYLKHDPQLCRAFRFSENSPNQTMTSSSICSWHHKISLGPHVNIKVNNKITFIQAANPAKLVLDVMRGWYLEPIGSFKLQSPIVVKSFVVLLEKLLRMSPQIQPHVKEDAAKFAVDWKARLVKTKARNPTEVFGLLHLLAIYKVASSVDSSELLDLFNSIYQRRNAPDLVPLLGLAHIIPDFIGSLVRKGDRLQAIRYIYEFKLVEKFPPVPILKDHLNSMKELAAKIHPEEMHHLAIVKAIGKPLHALRGAVRCIKDHQLAVECPLEEVLAQIQQLEEQVKENIEVREPPKKFMKNQNAVVQEEKIERPEQRKKFRKKQNASGPENIQRAESCKKIRNRKRRKAAGSDESQTQWHIRKHPRVEPLAETSLNVPSRVAYPASQSMTNFIGNEAAYVQNRTMPCPINPHNALYK